ncbi:hypothetical protein OF83DRAFT_1172127 [Amylostereum chailletii]|nr:hypothetical protein OF83DRAFT_1172127 [Amylostereum chailletii]
MPNPFVLLHVLGCVLNILSAPADFLYPDYWRHVEPATVVGCARDFIGIVTEIRRLYLLVPLLVDPLPPTPVATPARTINLPTRTVAAHYSPTLGTAWPQPVYPDEATSETLVWVYLLALVAITVPLVFFRMSGSKHGPQIVWDRVLVASSTVQESAISTISIVRKGFQVMWSILPQLRRTPRTGSLDSRRCIVSSTTHRRTVNTHGWPPHPGSYSAWLPEYSADADLTGGEVSLGFGPDINAASSTAGPSDTQAQSLLSSNPSQGLTQPAGPSSSPSSSPPQPREPSSLEEDIGATEAILASAVDMPRTRDTVPRSLQDGEPNVDIRRIEDLTSSNADERPVDPTVHTASIDALAPRPSSPHPVLDEPGLGIPEPQNDMTDAAVDVIEQPLDAENIPVIRIIPPSRTSSPDIVADRYDEVEVNYTPQVLPESGSSAHQEDDRRTTTADDEDAEAATRLSAISLPMTSSPGIDDDAFPLIEGDETSRLLEAAVVGGLEMPQPHNDSNDTLTNELHVGDAASIPDAIAVSMSTPMDVVVDEHVSIEMDGTFQALDLAQVRSVLDTATASSKFAHLHYLDFATKALDTSGKPQWKVSEASLYREEIESAAPSQGTCSSAGTPPPSVATRYLNQVLAQTLSGFNVRSSTLDATPASSAAQRLNELLAEMLPGFKPDRRCSGARADAAAYPDVAIPFASSAMACPTPAG